MKSPPKVRAEIVFPTKDELEQRRAQAKRWAKDHPALVPAGSGSQVFSAYVRWLLEADSPVDDYSSLRGA